jgi:hypothetical protein
VPRSRLATIVGQQGSPLCSIAIRRIDINGKQEKSREVNKNNLLCASFLSVVPTTLQMGQQTSATFGCGKIIEATIYTDHGTATYTWK